MQRFQEAGGVGTVHLGVVELEGDGECPLPEVPPVLAPDEEGVVVYAAVHAYCAVYLGLDEGGGADDHAVGEVMVCAGLGDLAGQAQVVGIELLQVVGEGHVAGTDFALPVGDDGAYGKVVVLH